MSTTEEDGEDGFKKKSQLVYNNHNHQQNHNKSKRQRVGARTAALGGNERKRQKRAAAAGAGLPAPTHAASPPQPQAQPPSETPVAGHPYGCGACPERYTTMLQLRDHLREGHPAAADNERPFRCAGCHRTYKNINGLKYHVNVSMVDGAHLESVRARGRPSKAPDQPPAFIDATPRELYGSLDHLAALATAAVGEAPDGGRFLEPVPPPKDPFWCPMRDCDKQYKQLAGLRYHLSNGHTPQPSLEELRALNPELASRISGRGDAYPKVWSSQRSKEADGDEEFAAVKPER